MYTFDDVQPPRRPRPGLVRSDENALRPGALETEPTAMRKSSDKAKAIYPLREVKQTHGLTNVLTSK